MKKSIKKAFSVFVACFIVASPLLAQEVIKKDSIQQKIKNEEGDRGVMLSASSATGPRDINVGLPPGVGGTPVLENGLPVVYFSWPELPNRAWRMDGMLDMRCFQLLDLRHTSIQYGEIGYSVSTWDNLGTDNLRGNIKLASNHYGLLNGTANLSGPLNKKGLQFSVGAYANYDPGYFDVGFTNYYADQTQMYKAALTQRYKFEGGVGSISAMYKYIKSGGMLMSFSPYVYKGDGKVGEYNGLKIGRNSFFEPSGKIQLMNPYTGDIEERDMINDYRTSSHNLDIIGSNEFKSSGLNLNYTLRYREAKGSIHIPAIASVMDATPGMFTYMDGTPYTGKDVSLVLKKGTKEIPIKTLAGVFELSKKSHNHHWKLGLTEQYYDIDNFLTTTSFYYQEVKHQPAKLQMVGVTDKYGNLPNYNSHLEANDGWENKLSLWFLDTWDISSAFTLKYGARIEAQSIKGKYATAANRTNGIFNDVPWLTFDKTYWNKGGYADLTIKLADSFGLLAEGGYNQWAPHIETYAGQIPVDGKQANILNAGFGVYYNHPMVSLVSKATYITKDNYLTRVSMTSSSNPNVSAMQTIVYDIEALGWTTDAVLKPFNGFNLHLLATLQAPKYKNYEGTAKFNNASVTDEAYNYTGNTVTSVPKLILEIDPSYQFRSLKIWGTARYSSKTYANLSNTIYFAPRWETFTGINYTFNKNLSAGVTVVNPLNSSGASGTIPGADLWSKAEVDKRLEDAKKNGKDGIPFAGTYIRPFTVEFSASYRF